MTNRSGFVGMICLLTATIAVVGCASSVTDIAPSEAPDPEAAALAGTPVDGTPPRAKVDDDDDDDDDDVARLSETAESRDDPEPIATDDAPDLAEPEPADETRAPIETLAMDCPASDDAGRLVWKAQHRKMFDAHLSYRQTNDAGQSLGAACNLRTHHVTSQGMANVALHCTGRSQAQMGYSRVGAAWGTRQGAPSCTKDICAAIYLRHTNGTLREIARGIHIKDRFFCGQTSERNDTRLDVDACTYADVVGALKHTGPTDDQSNLEYDAHWKLTGNPRTGERLKYELYECAAGTGGPSTCHDVPTPGYTCAQQRAWRKCAASWMKSGGYCAHTCGRC